MIAFTINNFPLNTSMEFFIVINEKYFYVIILKILFITTELPPFSPIQFFGKYVYPLFNDNKKFKLIKLITYRGTYFITLYKWKDNNTIIAKNSKILKKQKIKIKLV